MNDKVSLSVNVPGARQLHEERYEAFMGETVQSIDGDFNYREQEEIRYRLNVPLPCGCLMPIEDEEKYESEGFRATYECEHTTWDVERKGGIRVGRIQSTSSGGSSET